jgi:hypothetical protein
VANDLVKRPIWIDRDRRWMIANLMQAFPLASAGLAGTECEQWRQWKVAFAWSFERRWQDRWPVGVAYLWWNGRDAPRRVQQGTVEQMPEVAHAL